MLLVLVNLDESVDEQTKYVRIPILLSGNFHSAARSMNELAVLLNVPYLHAVESRDWKEEFKRAKTRPPLKTGGFII